jgi:hypothetical protein
MARCAVRAAFSGTKDGCEICVVDVNSFRPLLRGRGHRNAMSLPLKPLPLNFDAIFCG